MKILKKYSYVVAIIFILVFSAFIFMPSIKNKIEFDKGINDITKYCENKYGYEFANRSCQNFTIRGEKLDDYKIDFMENCTKQGLPLAKCNELLENFANEISTITESCIQEIINSSVIENCTSIFTNLQKTIGHPIKLNSSGELYFPYLNEPA